MNIFCFGHWVIRISNLFRISIFEFRIFLYFFSILPLPLQIAVPALFAAKVQVFSVALQVDSLPLREIHAAKWVFFHEVVDLSGLKVSFGPAPEAVRGHPGLHGSPGQIDQDGENQQSHGYGSTF